jgi:hypothetical protein
MALARPSAAAHVVSPQRRKERKLQFAAFLIILLARSIQTVEGAP